MRLPPRVIGALTASRCPGTTRDSRESGEGAKAHGVGASRDTGHDSAGCGCDEHAPRRPARCSSMRSRGSSLRDTVAQAVPPRTHGPAAVAARETVRRCGLQQAFQSPGYVPSVTLTVLVKPSWLVIPTLTV